MSALSVASISNMSDDAATAMLRDVRWPNGIECPSCHNVGAYPVRRRNILRCKACAKQFSETSGTPLSGMKLAASDLLLSASLFAGAAKGISSIQISNYVGRTQKTMFVLCHKFREAMARPWVKLSGVVQIDGCTIGGHIIQSNSTADKLQRTKFKKFTHRRVVVVARSFLQNATRCFVGNKESDAIEWIKEVVEPGSIIQADEARAWDSLRSLFKLMRVAHVFDFSANGAHTNYAESFFSVLRKLHYGTHHRIDGRFLQAYCDEMAWRQDNRRLSHEDRTRLLLAAILRPGQSRWQGYFQGAAI